MINEEVAEEFRKLYKKHYKVEISVEEARELGTRLINLFKVIYKPIPKDENKADPGKVELAK